MVDEPPSGVVGNPTGLCSGGPCERGGWRGRQGARSQSASGAHKEGDFILRDIEIH